MKKRYQLWMILSKCTFTHIALNNILFGFKGDIIRSLLSFDVFGPIISGILTDLDEFADFLSCSMVVILVVSKNKRCNVFEL